MAGKPDMSKHLLRDGVFRRLLKSLRKVLTRRVKKALEGRDEDLTFADDLELLHTLCSVWMDGPYAQAYFKSRDLAIAPLAAREVRRAIETSTIHDCELSLDHVALLRRVEATLGLTPRGYPSKVSKFLRAILARAGLMMRAIRRALPWRAPSG